MTPLRSVVVGKVVTFVLGFFLAGYNGTMLYVWYTAGKVEILGSLESSSFAPLYFTKTLIENGIFGLLGVGLLLIAILPLSLSKKRIVK
jgi:hypothetical protein